MLLLSSRVNGCPSVSGQCHKYPNISCIQQLQCVKKRYFSTTERLKITINYISFVNN